MNAFFATNRLSDSEKEDILKQHRTLYDGYRTLQPNVSNEQPLYVQDFAKDKVGAVLNNKGTVKPYTNVGINEQVQKEVCDECGAMQMSEGECSECGWKGEVGAMEESEKAMCSECGGQMMEGECSECGYKMEELDEVGHLDDIYNVEDLGDSDFDYVEGGGNDYGTFEKMHHMKKIKSEGIEDNYEDPDNEDDGFEDLQSDGGEMYEIGSRELAKGKKYKFKSPSFEDDVEYEDEYEDKSGGHSMFKFKGEKASHIMPSKSIEDYLSNIDEQGYTGGGNAPDMDISNIDPAYDFESGGPSSGDGPFDVEADDMDLDKSEEASAFDFVSNGPDSVYPTEGEMDEEEDYEFMDSAFGDEELEETDISGVQGIYGDMEPAFDFDSKGPGKAGPYQHSQYESENGETEEQYLPKHVWDDAHKKGHVKTHKELGIDSDNDFEEDELEVDFDEFDPRDKSWEEIKAHTGNWDEIDEDLREDFVNKKNRIMEMMLRMKVIK